MTLKRMDLMNAAVCGNVYSKDLKWFEDFVLDLATKPDDVIFNDWNLSGIARQYIKFGGLSSTQWNVMQSAFLKQGKV